jgi:hypothetical protein
MEEKKQTCGWCHKEALFVDGVCTECGTAFSLPFKMKPTAKMAAKMAARPASKEKKPKVPISTGVPAQSSQKPVRMFP